MVLLIVALSKKILGLALQLRLMNWYILEFCSPIIIRFTNTAGNLTVWAGGLKFLRRADKLLLMLGSVSQDKKAQQTDLFT
jgi:hypothetical protein